MSQSVVSEPLKKHGESGSITKSKRSTLILVSKESLLKQYGTWCII